VTTHSLAGSFCTHGAARGGAPGTVCGGEGL